ncbi:hypothetical protein CAPTEDRAFT_216257 [Capitella teleta]|uniref:Uncharacterized protein n=1 Tax=Capitella teleta TaxID=283909 RepID=R7VIV8_CAPTE|nr:hypothetical protein CAPTEDRAFT_216257 [Capitella teleta]|eukprot:ELU18564.1 hypothetical protein CAPTEDRAFT_216257 [Capitella teleta]
MATDADSATWFQLKVVRGRSTENRVVKAAPGTSVKNLLAHELPECTIPRVTGKTKAGSGEVDMDGDVVKGLQKEYAIAPGGDNTRVVVTSNKELKSKHGLLKGLSAQFRCSSPRVAE